MWVKYRMDTHKPPQIVKSILRVGHIAFGLFMLFAPFMSDDPEVFLLHAQLCLFLFTKWTIKEWECGFTMMEYRLRGCKREHAYLYQVLHPVTDIHEYQMDFLMYVLVITLGMYSYYRFEMATRG